MFVHILVIKGDSVVNAISRSWPRIEKDNAWKDGSLNQLNTLTAKVHTSGTKKAKHCIYIICYSHTHTHTPYLYLS